MSQIVCGYCAESGFETREDLAEHCHLSNHLFSSLMFHHLCPQCGSVDNIEQHFKQHHPTSCFYCFNDGADHEECEEFWETEQVTPDITNLISYCGYCHQGPFESKALLAEHCSIHRSTPHCPRCATLPLDGDMKEHFRISHRGYCFWCNSYNDFYMFGSVHRECREAS